LDSPGPEAFRFLLKTFLARSRNAPIYVAVHITNLFINLGDGELEYEAGGVGAETLTFI
jgi:hypothetical protein